MSCKINRYLADVNEQAEEMFSKLVKQMKIRESVTEQLKADNQIEWVRRINSIQQRASEIVNTEIIFD